MNAQQRINDSWEYLGSGTYSHLSPVITPRGIAAGWVYVYPDGICRNGVNYSKFTTLDAMLADGVIELVTQTSTVC